MDTYLANDQLGAIVNFTVTGPGGTSNTYIYRTPAITSFSVNGYTSPVVNNVLQVYNVTNPTVQWSSSNAVSCVAQSSTDGSTSTATNDFGGTVSASGSKQLMIGDSYYNQRYIRLYCVNADGVPTPAKYAFIGGKG